VTLQIILTDKALLQSMQIESFDLNRRSEEIKLENKRLEGLFSFLYVMICYVMLCYVMLCYVMLCYVMLCYVMLCYVVLCYVLLCYVTFYYVFCLTLRLFSVSIAFYIDYYSFGLSIALIVLLLRILM
jgi:hypothetical protein